MISKSMIAFEHHIYILQRKNSVCLCVCTAPQNRLQQNQTKCNVLLNQFFGPKTNFLAPRPIFWPQNQFFGPKTNFLAPKSSFLAPKPRIWPRNEVVKCEFSKYVWCDCTATTFSTLQSGSSPLEKYTCALESKHNIDTRTQPSLSAVQSAKFEQHQKSAKHC